MSTRKTTASSTRCSILVSGLAVGDGHRVAPRSDARNRRRRRFTAPPMNSAPITGALDAQTFRNVAKAQSPMVVSIRTEIAPASAGSVGLLRRRRAARRFAPPVLRRTRRGRRPGRSAAGDQDGRRPPAPREQTTVASGSGFIINKDGLILTNNHVVEGATKIEVGLFGEDPDQVYQAKIVGRDELTDSALIQLTEKPNHPLPEAKFGDSSQMAAGDWVDRDRQSRST